MNNKDIITKIKAEIERLNTQPPKPIPQITEAGYHLALKDVLSLLDTLESENPMQEGLEEEMEKFIETFGWGKTKHLAEKELISATARHFAKWGAEHLKE